jgi:hypothetical protein
MGWKAQATPKWVTHANAPMPADALQIHFDQHDASVSKNHRGEMTRVKIWRPQNRQR